MLNIPESIKTLYKTDGTRKNLRVHFPHGEMSDITNSSIVRESLKFTESVCSQNVFRFGLAEASVIQFETVGVGNMFGMTIECAIEIDTSSLSAAEIAAIQAGTWDGTLVLLSDSDIGYGYFRIRLGTFIVDSCPRNHDTMTHRQVTAYSRAFSSINVNLPSASVWPKINARASALMALAFNAGFVEMAQPEPISTTRKPVGSVFWDSSSTSYTCYIESAPNVGYKAILSRRVPIVTGIIGEQTPSFVSIILPGYDAAAYEARGVYIADIITSGTSPTADLRYNQNGRQIYSSNEDALRDRCPWLFYPCIITTFQDVVTGKKFSGVVQRVNQGVMTPVINDGQNTAVSGFYVWPERYRVIDSYLYYVADGPDTSEPRVFFPADGGANNYKYIDTSGYLSTPPVVTPYALSDYSMLSIGFTNSGSSSARFGQYDAETLSNISAATYSFDATINPGELLDGMLEFDGLFGREKRAGGWESFALTNTSPVALTPGDYNSVWWDEYNVSPIGTVVVKFLNNYGGEETANIVIGSGSSVYDMTDNSALEVIADASLSDVQTMLNTSFLPRSQYAAFTPIELDMPGWPWLQAGDALAVTAQDGTTVNSYALRIEMSGIQNLSSNITANAGEIMEV